MAHDQSPLSASEATEFRTRLTALNMAPMWEDVDRNEQGRGGPEPPLLWRWDDVEPMISAAVRATSIEHADRRVLSLRKPASNSPALGLVGNMVAALQILMPGETAPAHRHTPGALRFVMEGDGADTVVDGKPCPMEPGDMIITPGWTWHEHVHHGSKRMVWLDGLDVPIHRYLGTMRFEPGPAHDLPAQAPDAAFQAAGLVPQNAPLRPFSPLYRYPWAAAKAALAAAPRGKDGSRSLRYTNPMTGGPAIELIDCYLLGLEPGQPTAPTRSSSSAVCLAVQGSGTSTVGERTLTWAKNSIFTIPHGNFTSHRADEPSVLFLMTDRDVLQRLGLLRDEVRAS